MRKGNIGKVFGTGLGLVGAVGCVSVCSENHVELGSVFQSAFIPPALQSQVDVKDKDGIKSVEIYDHLYKESKLYDGFSGCHVDFHPHYSSKFSIFAPILNDHYFTIKVTNISGRVTEKKIDSEIGDPEGQSWEIDCN